MKKRLIYCVLALVLLISLVGVSCTASTPGTTATPKVLTLTAMPPGTVVNAVGVGISNVATQYSGIKVNLVPQTSEMVWVPLMVTGEADMGVGTNFPLWHAYMGTFVFEDIAKQAGVKGFPIRLVCCGSGIMTAFAVRGDDSAQHARDLKGKRVLWYPEDTFGYLGTTGRLAMEGLTPDDIVKVPISNMLEAARALMDNRLDACDIAPTAPIAAEAAAAVGMRYLPCTITDESLAKLHEWAPVFYPVNVPGGVLPGIPEPLTLLQFDCYFAARADLSDDAVYDVLKSIWDHNDELTATPVTQGWTKDKFVTENMFIPYHPGAIKFYKEMGVWTDTAEKNNAAVLAKEPK